MRAFAADGPAGGYSAGSTRGDRRNASIWPERSQENLLLERFTGTTESNDRQLRMDCCERHNAEVRLTIPTNRLLEWRATEGWEPISLRPALPAPREPFRL